MRGWWNTGRPRIAAGVAVLLAAAGLALWRLPPASADSCLPNPVVCENGKAGSPDTEWDVLGDGDDSIQGFATDMSVNLGQRIDFKIQTNARAYTIDIYRLGWYGGSGARKVASVPPSVPLPEIQPSACVSDPTTEIYDCGNWAVSASWTVPTTAVSGVYVAKLTRTDTGGASHITFVVRDDASTSKLLFKTSDATWQAYNTYGGSDFYQGNANGRAYKISYNRPYATRGVVEGRDFLFSNEYPMIRFLERNGYDVSYTTDVDSDRHGALIRDHKVFLSVGHDEYWSYGERANVEAARDAGVNLAFFSGNEVYWRTRWEASEDGSNASYRTLVCYKETWSDGKIDPTTQWTGTYRDPRLSPPAEGGDDPENALTGTMFMSNSDDLALQVPAAQGRYRLWRNTTVATQAAGQTATLAPHTIGYESDEDLDNGFRPPGLIDLSTTTGATPQYLQDFGQQVAPGTTTHHLTLYRAPSGALVFSAGTIQWAWGLDDDHDGTATTADPRMQQATVNLLADLGVQPATLMSGLVAATASTDTTAPSVLITAPLPGAGVANGAAVTVSGTASDVGGQVAGVEVSTDGGATWHPATGTTSWSYTFYATGTDQQTVRARGVDDSANIGTPAVLQLAVTGTDSLLGDRVPRTPAASDTSAVELGVKWVPQTDGYVTGIRFYKGTGNTGTHTGTLWTGTGARLATGTFTNETGTGWQTLTFATPVPVTAGSAYVASYYAPSGHYAADPWFFATADLAAPPLSAPRSTQDSGNGVYRGGSSGFPTHSYNATNYYVDLRFVASAAVPPQVTSAAPLPNASYVAVGTHPSVVFSKPVAAASIQFTLTDGAGAAVGGSVGYDASSKTATFTPTAPLAAGTRFTGGVRATDPNGNPMAAAFTWSFTTDPGTTAVSSLFPAGATPGTPWVDDSNAVELGVRFTPSTSGKVIGVRFFQGTGNSGTHTGTLWTADGTPLAQVTFWGESGYGWQTGYFATPVPVIAGTTYVASYFAPNGNYAADPNYFGTTVTNGPLSAPAGNNGLYLYGSDAFPTSSYHASNYWVDPLFVADPAQSPNPPPAGAVSVFPATATPATANWPDNSAIEVGAKFTAEVAGTVYGVRFYKGAQNTGTHTGSLWTATGTRLATGTFVNETGSGWQTLVFFTPVAIAANTTYVVSYSTTVGYYSVTPNQFVGAGVDSPPLHIPAGGAAYHYGAGFPNVAAGHNFWVDVVFKAGG